MESIEGRNPILEALRAGRPINKILVARGTSGSTLKQIYELARSKHVPILTVEKEKIVSLAQTRHHQGIVALAAPKEYATPNEIVTWAREKGDVPLLLLLDQIEDPQNLGSILRVAEATGSHGVIIPKRRSASLTPAVARASAGALEYVPVARVANLGQTIDLLKEKQCWIVGADANAPQLYFEADLTGPLVLVIGNEARGISRLVKKKCDLTVRLPMRGHLASLNAAVAAAVILYEVMRQRSQKNRKPLNIT